jgi:3-deoxy-D-manno-octulosonic-acid transferase
MGFTHIRRSIASTTDSTQTTEQPIDVLLADTTGEMLSFISAADIVIMGKSLAGHNEGHNILEPAILAKPVITGGELRNFRFVLKAMLDADAVKTVSNETELLNALAILLDDPKAAVELGKRAKSAVEKYRGATQRTIELCETLLK